MCVYTHTHTLGAPCAMQEEWQKNAEMFERDVAAEASWDDSRAGEMVDEFISEHWMPRKKSRGARYSTREETLAYYKRVRAIADRYIAKEEGDKPGPMWQVAAQKANDSNGLV